jgi:hypothetical protein
MAKKMETSEDGLLYMPNQYTRSSHTAPMPISATSVAAIVTGAFE